MIETKNVRYKKSVCSSFTHKNKERVRSAEVSLELRGRHLPAYHVSTTGLNSQRNRRIGS